MKILLEAENLNISHIECLTNAKSIYADNDFYWFLNVNPNKFFSNYHSMSIRYLTRLYQWKNITINLLVVL